ncbi:MAG: penicillin-binding protein 2 [Bacteroidales bacterium]
MLSPANTNYYTKRRNVMVGLIVFMGIVFLIRLFHIQLIDHSYKLSASNNVLRYMTAYPARGLIYDRNGELLVYNEAHYDLMVIPHQVRNIDTTEFCLLLGIDKETFETRLSRARLHSPFRASIFDRQISKNTYASFQEKLFRFSGFFVQPRTLRKYDLPIAAHTLGYVGEAGPEVVAGDPYYRSGDYIGISGLERSYEEELRGQKGLRVRMVDVLNRDIGPYMEGRFDTLSVPGKNLTITLDGMLQAYGERLMQNKRGSIVAIEPATGEILALVSSPAYDPNLLVGRVRGENYNLLQRDTLKPLFNRALMAQYPPGSVFKIVNTLIALQEGVIDLNTRYSCSGAYHSGGLTVRCRPHPNPVNVLTSIQHSCNTFSCITFRNTLDKPGFGSIQNGFTNWRNHVRSFGLGQVFDSDLPFELSGLVVSPEYYDRIYGPRGWRSLTVISLAIGQGELGTTPIQLANMAAIVANRGYYHTPHMVRAIEDPDGTVKALSGERKQTTIEDKYFEAMAEAMHLVVKEGTGAFSQIPGIEMGGKTGTVQNPHGENHSVFVAFAPVQNPRIAISVIVENAGYGSTWAAPIASLMVEQYLKGSVDRSWFEQRILEARF